MQTPRRWLGALICCCCLSLLACQAAPAAAAGAQLPGCSPAGCVRPPVQPQRLQHAAGAATAAAAAGQGTWPQHTRALRAGRQLLQDAGGSSLPDASNPAMAQWLEESSRYSQRYLKGSCFRDFPGFIAKDITEFVRLLKDPAATHIELKGNIVFSHDHFPPENANDMSKGINITHQVEIRACTSAQDPIVVDVNNAMQQVYVSGRMVWAGSIKFINTFPSPRRGGMFALVSVLSVEGNGSVEFRGLQIHGNEPGPLFLPDDPYWKTYRNDSAFVPQPDMFTVIDSHNLIMHNWTFNKAAWVLASQGRGGVVRPDGDAYWRWADVLMSWSPAPSTGAGGLSGSALALAVALPVVFGMLLLLGCGAFVWQRRRWRRRQALDLAAGKEEQDTMGPVMLSGPSRASTTGAGAGPLSSYTAPGSSGGEAGRLECGSALSNSSMVTAHLIEQARRRMQETSATRESGIVLESLLGEGTFGKVYSAMWKGTLVAVKTMLLPAAMSGKERREKMAIMETAISSSLSHPNIVQTYTYEVRPLTGELARKALERKAPVDAGASAGSALTFLEDADGASDHHGWELRLVLEMADLGNLKEFLGRGGFKLPDRQRDTAAIVATALDITRAMLHLHTENIIHSDLKARNVLLKSAGGDARGFVAKVSDFGLSMRIDPTETHVSNFYQGTLTHMAPEVLMYGKISFASDVYAFGIILWEMYTAQQAFKGVPRALLGHEVTKMGRRPEFPLDCPFDYQLLACRCWESDPAIRPTFAQILSDLERMSSKLQGRRMDSASSLPLQPNDAARRLSTSTAPGDQLASAGQQQAHPALMAGAAAGASGAAAAAAAAAAAGLLTAVGSRQAGSPNNDDLNAARYHNWEPQTSLLELGSTVTDTATHNLDSGSEQAQLAQQTRRSALQPGSQQPAASSLLPASVISASGAASSSQPLGAAQSGSWDAPTGGLWLTGSLAPVSGPNNLQGSVASSGQQPGVVQLQQQQQQYAAGEPGQAAVQPGQLQEPRLSLQQYVQLRQQQFASQVQQQQQQQQQPRELPVQQGQQVHPARSADASSSGAYLDQSSSLGLEEHSTGVTHHSQVTDVTEGVEAVKPNGVL